LHSYSLYGFNFRSRWQLAISVAPVASQPEIEILEGGSAVFAEGRREAESQLNPNQRLQYVRLADGRDYLRWPLLFEFLISPDGGRITGRPLEGTSWETFQTYLLGQVLSFALIKQGIEPLHCTAVVTKHGAIGLLGDCGYGKSSLAAAFLQAGYPLLTDDLLVLKESGSGFLAYPSFPRIKLFPEVARAFLGDQADGALMNPFTRKLIIPLDQDLSWQTPILLKAFFVLRPPGARSRSPRVAIRTMRQRRAFLSLTANTFNAAVTEPQRLNRLFSLADKLAARIPFKSLSYPKGLDRLPEVTAAILKNLDRHSH